MTPWKTSRKMRWNVRSLANCFIYGYWTLLLCQILNLFGAVDFLIEIVLLDCYLVQFAMIIPLAIFTFALCTCVWSCKNKPVFGREHVSSHAFQKAQLIFSELSHFSPPFCFSASPRRLHCCGSKPFPSQLLMLSWQALSKDFQVSLQSLCWLLGAPRRMQILESSTLAKCPANHNCNLTEISVLGFCSCSEVSRHHGKWFLLSESAGSCFGWHRSQAFQVFPLLLRRTTFRAGLPEMEMQQQVEVGGCVICLQFAVCQGRWSSRKTYGDGRMGERWDLQRWWLDQQPFLHKGCTVEKSHQLFSFTVINSIMWCCVDPNPIQVVLWFTGCWIPVTTVQSWQQLQKDRSSSSLSPAPPNPAFFWCTLVCWSTPQQP